MAPHDADIFNLNDLQPIPQRGSMLVARPTVEDNCFGHSVIMMVDGEEDEGSMGLILNRPTNLTMHDIMPDLKGSENIRLFLGGPVNLDLMFFIHTLGNKVIPKSMPLSNGIYLGGDVEAIKTWLANNQPEDHVKFFVGYSGWQKNQLADEIDRHDWVVLDTLDAASIMSQDNDLLWRKAVAQFGDRYRLWLNWPASPSDN